MSNFVFYMYPRKTCNKNIKTLINLLLNFNIVSARRYLFINK